MQQSSLVENASSVGHDLLVLVGPANLWRECLADCLEMNGYAVLPVIALAQWINISERYPVPVAVLLCEPRKIEPTQISRVVKRSAIVAVVDIASGVNLQELVQLGVRAVISPSSTSVEMMIGAIRFVQSGGSLVPANLPGTRDHGRADFGDILTGRQLQVVEEIRKGKSNKEIACRLDLRESTVKVHIKQIMRKLRARNRTEIAVLANELRDIGQDLLEIEGEAIGCSRG